MNFFRRVMKSKVGGFIAVGFLAVIAFAFIAGDINNMANNGGSILGGGGEVARVGKQSVSVADLQDRTQRVYERLRQQRPELTMAQFLGEGGLREVLDQMLATKALIAYGEKHGIRISKKLVDAEIAGNPAFADVTGNFSQAQFQAMLQQQGVQERALREDIVGGIIQQQILGAAAAGARTPGGMVLPYAAMLLEQRTGEMIAIPSAAFAPTTPPTEAQLKAFYAAHPDDFTLPEQRKLRYMLVSRERFDAQAAPTDAELAAAYKARAAQYAAREARDISQVILPTEKAAKDLAAKASGGRSLDELAREAGLSATHIDGVNQTTLAGQTNAEIGKAGFAAIKGQLIGPIRSPLGWAVLRVEDVRTIAGKTLEQARAELTPELQLTKSRQLFAAFINDIDGKLGEGSTLAELAKANGLTIVETPFITAQGRAIKDPAYKPDEAVTAMLKQGFSMGQDDDPQVVSVKAEEQAAILAPGERIAAGPPPFAEGKTAAEIAWRLAQGAGKAKAVADQVTAALNKGQPVAEALKAAGGVQTPRQPLSVRRLEINQQGGRIPPPLQALFTLRTNSAKLVPMENNQGFMIVRLEKIAQEDPRSNAQLLQSTSAGLANVLGSEYARQLVTAIEKDLAVSRNATAIASVEKALREANGAAPAVAQ